jgi:hypothetical protein
MFRLSDCARMSEMSEKAMGRAKGRKCEVCRVGPVDMPDEPSASIRYDCCTDCIGDWNTKGGAFIVRWAARRALRFERRRRSAARNAK